MTLPATPSSVADYGVPSVGFRDYIVGVVDPTTDQSAASANKAFADIAQMSQTRVTARVKLAVAGAVTPTVVTHNALWGNAGGVVPVILRTGVGVATITWTAAQVDPYGSSVAINLIDAFAELDNAAFTGFARAVVTAPNVVTLYQFSTAFVAADLTGVNVKVFAY